MDNLEKVEKIREKTGVSYEEAKIALENSNYDLLDAIVYLEKKGKVTAPKLTSYTTIAPEESQEFAKAQESYENSCKDTSMGEALNKFFKWCGRLVKKGCDTTFHVMREGKKVMSVPVLVLVLLLIFAFWIVLPLLVVGLFCDCKYSFEGIKSTTVDLNDMCNKASETCESIKNDFQNK